MKDYYEILGIERNANEEDIRKAFRRLALKFHPDRHQEAPKLWEDKFKEINEAYSILSENVKRKQYDYLLDLAQRGSESVFFLKGCRKRKRSCHCRIIRNQTFY